MQCSFKQASGTLVHQTTVWPIPYYKGLLVLALPDGCAMLMRPNKAETAVPGCYSPGDLTQYAHA